MRTSNTDQVSSTDRQASGNQPDNSTPTGTTQGLPFNGTVDLAQLTPLGSPGTLTVQQGIITAYNPPT